jgi:hypothetical protein
VRYCDNCTTKNPKRAGTQRLPPGAKRKCGRCPALIERKAGRRFCLKCTKGKHQPEELRSELEERGRAGLELRHARGEELTYDEVAELDGQGDTRSHMQAVAEGAMEKLRALLGDKEDWL